MDLPACPQLDGSKQEYYGVTFSCVQLSPMEERSPSALLTSFIAPASLERAPEILLQDVAV